MTAKLARADAESNPEPKAAKIRLPGGLDPQKVREGADFVLDILGVLSRRTPTRADDDFVLILRAAVDTPGAIESLISFLQMRGKLPA